MAARRTHRATARRWLKLVAGWAVVFFALDGVMMIPGGARNMLQAVLHLLSLAVVPGVVAGAAFATAFLWLGPRLDSARLRTAMAIGLGFAVGAFADLGILRLVGELDELDRWQLVTVLVFGGIPGAVAGLCSGLAAAHWSRPMATPPVK